MNHILAGFEEGRLMQVEIECLNPPILLIRGDKVPPLELPKPIVVNTSTILRVLFSTLPPVLPASYSSLKTAFVTGDYSSQNTGDIVSTPLGDILTSPPGELQVIAPSKDKEQITFYMAILVEQNATATPFQYDISSPTLNFFNSVSNTVEFSINGRFLAGGTGAMLVPKDFKLFKFSLNPKDIADYKHLPLRVSFREQMALSEAVFSNVYLVDKDDNPISNF